AIDWYPERCIHTGRCLAALPDVFDRQRRPWIVPAGHSADERAAGVQGCPSGALQFRRLDGGAAEQAPAGTTITPQPNGPLLVHGAVRVEDEAGNVLREDLRMALCRCGQS